MKKYIAMLAMLVTAGGSAMAQNITLYGTLDASVQHVQNANAAGQNTTGLVDSSISSSVWGLRGSEDLGGGRSAIFNVESDIQTNNGGMNHNGLFRRAANVGLSSSNLGRLELGVKMNPLIAAAGQLMPVGGNSYAANVALGMRYADFFTRNAVTYTSPTIAGATLQVQYGASNTVDATNSGSVVAGWLNWEIGAATLTLAAQDRSTGGTASSANGTNGEKQTTMAGAKYKVTKDLTFGLGRTNNDVAGTKVAAWHTGAGLQITPSTLLGVNYVTSDDQSKLTNVQLRYALSKRTTLYSQVGYAQNGNTNNAFNPMFTNTGTSPAVNIAGYSGVASTNQASYAMGVIHRF